ncbi:MAG TPA: serine--tRNA ligase [Nitrospiria bacterium]
MLDIRQVREHPEEVLRRLGARGPGFNLDEILGLEKKRREITGEAEKLKARRNQASAEIPQLKKKGKPVDDLMKEMKDVSARIKILDEELRGIEEQLSERLLYLPNLLHESVPGGRDEKDNQEIRKWGQTPDFGFEPRSHWDIGEGLGILDFDRAARMTGARFALYVGAGARLERALINYMLDIHTQRHGYQEVIPPFIVNRESMTGTGQLPKFEDDLFRLRDNDWFLIPTAEVPVTNIHREEILDGDRLPYKYAAYTPCFRREAGSHGKDTRGLIRQHQFNKVELVKFAAPERSYEELEGLVADAEAVLQGLELPYRVVLLCSGDTGFSSAKTYDLEVWVPSQNTYREISSCSNFEAFQARRAGIRFRTGKTKKTEFVHTLNGSGLAVGRALVAILENFQRKDGSVEIPKVLRSYMGGMEEIKAD